MALSREEQRLLEQMELVLAVDDPRLAKKLRSNHAGRFRPRGKVVWTAASFLVGLVALVLGMEVSIFVTLAGFVVMLVSSVSAATAFASWQDLGSPAVHDADAEREHGPQDLPGAA